MIAYTISCSYRGHGSLVNCFLKWGFDPDSEYGWANWVMLSNADFSTNLDLVKEWKKNLEQDTYQTQTTWVDKHIGRPKVTFTIMEVEITAWPLEETL